jgi:hypothetical protein
MASSASARIPLPGPLAARIEAESVRRGVPASELLGEAVEAFLDEDSTDESLIAVGGDLGPDEAPRPVSAAGAEAIRDILAGPLPAATPALRKLLRGL